jgi:hypothetical protein
MKKYKWEEFVEWMYEQPDDRKVLMSDGDISKDNSNCCLLAQFIREKRCKFGHVDTYGNFSSIFFWKDAVVEIPTGDIFSCFKTGDESYRNFKYFKNNLKPEFDTTK